MRIAALFAALATALLPALPGWAEVRIKDIATFEGVRENQLVGYGLVVGLNGTGDTLRNSPFTEKSIEAMLERLGVGNLSEDSIKTANTAAVMVTAMLPNEGPNQFLARYGSILRLCFQRFAHVLGGPSYVSCKRV